MPHAVRWAGAPAVGRPRRPVAGRRAWRRRSRRAQVSAVAVILGLLLVVTFIANYLATALPNTMGQNDLQHELTVENQVAQLSARLEAVALAGAVGAEVSQPVTLGSVGAPPFAGPDASFLTALSAVANTTGNHPQSSLSFTLVQSSNQIPFRPNGVSGFVVHLENTYAPGAEVAFDEGAVLFAQPGGSPIFIVPPPITLSHGVLTLFVPWFANGVTSEAGTGTADVSLRLLSTTTLTVPLNGLTLLSGSTVTYTVVSQYASAWYSYFSASSSPFSSYVTCSGSSSVCTALYNPAGIAPLGTVTVTIPVSAITTLNLVTVISSVAIS